MHPIIGSSLQLPAVMNSLITRYYSIVKVLESRGVVAIKKETGYARPSSPLPTQIPTERTLQIGPFAKWLDSELQQREVEAQRGWRMP